MRYGTGRKIGCGFNHPRILGRGFYDWRQRYDLMRRITRFRPRSKRPPWPIPAGLAETLRQYARD